MRLPGRPVAALATSSLAANEIVYWLAVHCANNVELAAGIVYATPAATALPVPSAAVFQPANVKPVRVDEVLAAVIEVSKSAD
ncbi:unannotated protein [freshwater metagenome]|uniref:Unannotated protein n=1 Tax=freshwater metagenome TaxID=449393 RepID=A0A6J6G6L6_9ZZZZ